MRPPAVVDVDPLDGRDDPALLSIFRTELAGYGLDPLYRVTVVSPESLAAW